MSGEVELLIYVLETLGHQWRDYKNLKAGARREFEQLKRGLGEIEAFLRDAAVMSDKSQHFRTRESEIRELVYDVEDTIEICLTKMAAAKTKSWLKQFLENISTEMEQKVKSLRQERLQPTLEEIRQKFGIAENKHGYSSSFEKQLPEVETYQSNEELGEASSHDQSNMADKIVDFEDEAIIIGYLMQPRDNLDVIAVTGMAGLGKTTFAQKIFQNKDIMAKFPLRIWIHVSVNFNKRDAFQHILRKITVKEPFVQSEQQLIKSVRKILENEAFLLVTDDVWTKDDWKAIEEILPKNNGKGRVLVTSRQTDVAAGANVIRTPHQLSFLDSTKSLKLLKLQVFDNLEHCHEELEEVGKVIADKCGGVPLIVLVIGGILKDIFTNTRGIRAIKDKWAQVSQNVPKHLNEDQDKLITRALELSYRRLGHELRLCFLYTGLFPERHVIPASTLTQLWIAEGFVHQKEGQSLEENAEKILDTLIMMNLIVVEKKYLGKVKTCLVHDMVREFCRAKAMEENLFKVIKGSNPPVAFRRLCFDSDPSEFLSQVLEGVPVRSFLCFSKESVDLDAIHKSTVFNLLRVLNCRSIKIQQFPADMIKKLILLKHITLSDTDLQELPEEISHLVNLQTLIVDTKSHSITVKAKILKMIQLRRVKTKATIILDDKNWKSKARGNLETISRLSPKSCKAALSERAPNLKTLGIQGKLGNLVQTMSLVDFPQLEKLKLVNDLDDKSKDSNQFLLTGLDRFPVNLKSLTLSKTLLQWDVHMPLLAKIKTLEILKLKENAFTGDDWLANEGECFPKLQFLLIEKLVLVKWEASNTDFPRLSSLVVKNCVELKEIPVSLAKYLENLEIDGVNKSVVDSAIKIKEKQTEQNQKWEVPFKLTIGSGCDQALYSGTINADIDANQVRAIGI